jgi:hypothetical protein
MMAVVTDAGGTEIYKVNLQEEIMNSIISTPQIES